MPLHACAAAIKTMADPTVQRYQEIIDTVVSRVKPSFNEEGIDE
jgi:hypothetical protein